MERNDLYDFISNRTENCRILVVGDVMLDQYYYGEVTRISPEAPVPINRVTSQRETLGGAANVAHNLALLGCRTMIAGFVGEDDHCRKILGKFHARGIDAEGLIRTDHPTTTKMRIIGGHQQIVRLDFEDTSPQQECYVEQLLAYVSHALGEKIDVVIISDYNKGVCTERICQQVIREAHRHDIPVIIDPKGHHWEKYAQADYLTPNMKEINEVLTDPIGNQDESVERAARELMQKFDLKHLLATRSEKGLSIISPADCTHIPTRSQDVFDVSGAGDTVIAVFALALAGGIRKEEAAYLGNLAAGVVVSKLGTYAVSKEELLKAMRIAEQEKE